MMRGLWASTRRALDLALGELADDTRAGSGAVAAAIVAASVVVVAVCRGLQALTVDGHDGAIAWLSAVAVAAVAVAALVVLGWLFWQTRQQPEDTMHYVGALVLTVIVIGLAVESFAGISTLLAARGTLRSATSGQVSLWDAERHYLWHLTSAVPLLRIPERVGWDEPAVFVGGAARGLLLGFQLVLVAPLVRLGLDAYQLFERRVATSRMKALARDARGGRRRPGVVQPASLGTVWRVAGELALLAMAGAGLLVTVADPGSFANRRVDDLTAGGLDVAGVHVDLHWVSALGPILAAVATIGVCVVAYACLLERRLTFVDRWTTAAGTLVAFLLLVIVVGVTASTLTLGLLRVGVADAAPPIDGQEWGAVVESHAWNVIDALPGPDVVATLRWRPDHDLTGSLNGTVILLETLAVFAVVLFPIARAIRSFALHARPPPPGTATVTAAKELALELRSTRDAVAKCHSALVSPPRRPVPSALGDDRFVGASLEAFQAIEGLEPKLDRVEALFGPGDVSTSAGAAAVALDAWHRAMLSPRAWMLDDAPQQLLFAPTARVDAASLAALRRAADEAVEGYVAAARKGLDAAARDLEGPRHRNVRRRGRAAARS